VSPIYEEVLVDEDDVDPDEYFVVSGIGQSQDWRFVATIKSPRGLFDLPEKMTWTAVRPLPFAPFQESLAQRDFSSQNLLPGTLYAFRFLDAAGASETLERSRLERIGFRDITLLPFRKFLHLPGHPGTVSEWIGIALWSGPNVPLKNGLLPGTQFAFEDIQRASKRVL
jgi:hypothetical protein